MPLIPAPEVKQEPPRSGGQDRQSHGVAFSPNPSTSTAEPEPEYVLPVADPLAPTVEISGKAEAFKLSDSVDDSALPNTVYRKKHLWVLPDVDLDAEFLLASLEDAIRLGSSITITKDQKEKIRGLLETKPNLKIYLTYLDEIVRENGSVDTEHQYFSPLLGTLEEAVYGCSSYNSDDDP